jgi:hypothetical protein
MRRLDLIPDCGSCAALCCVATSFEASEDFAIDKPAGVACPYVTSDCRCAIHSERVERGFPGCTVYDCFGAGQRTTRAFALRPSAERERNAVFLALRVVHELLWMLTEAAKLCPPGFKSIRAELEIEIHALDGIAQACPEALVAIDLEAHRTIANATLRRLGEALAGRDRTALARELAADGPLLTLARRKRAAGDADD